ncbi:hypothetical protein QE152_g13497 [Popillia japonica]|uniref:Uncharacterized protein n=1 Tax=Popillia japonica TaxID=7064 RepID=A0AAW1LCX1_POPJA
MMERVAHRTLSDSQLRRHYNTKNGIAELNAWTRQGHSLYVGSSRSSGGESSKQSPDSLKSSLSLGVGYTDGKKMVIKRISTSPEELQQIFIPPL